MPVYNCTVIDARGQVSKTTVIASSQAEAAADLAARGMSPMAISESEGGGGSISFEDILRKIGRVRRQEITLFLRMMSSLIASGITITEAITVLHEQTENRKFKYILGDIKTKIEAGTSFSDALAVHDTIFPYTAVSMVRAGELGGILETVLDNLVTFMEKRAALKGMIIRSFIYPSVVLVVAIGVVIFLVVFVIPRFMMLLQGAQLPWNTQLLMDISDFLISNGLVIGISMAGLVAVIITLFFIEKTRYLIDLYKVRLPVFGPIFRFGIIVQFCRTFASLLDSGIPIVEGLKTTSDTLTNEAVKKSIEDVVEKVVAGEQLSENLAEISIFTSLMISLFRIGEQTGNMSESIALVADIYEQQLEDRIEWMTSMIEPALIISLGGIVGFVAWGLVAGMLAMY